MTLVYTGFCQAPPPGCPRAIYKLMVDCWYVFSQPSDPCTVDFTNLLFSGGHGGWSVEAIFMVFAAI